MADGVDRGAPPRLERVKPAAPGATRGLAPREVTAAAAIAAGLAWEGGLAGDGPLRLWYLAAAAQATGHLAIETERAAFTLDFKRGVVEHASSSAPEDDLGRFLVARGTVGAEALADAERIRASQGGDLVGALAALKLMNPAESFRTIQEHGAAVVGRAIAAERGKARWDPQAKAPPSSFPLGPRWGLPCEAARRLDGLAVRKLLGDRVQRLAARSGGRVELSELKLTALEARAAGLFDGRSSAAQLAADRPGETDAVLRVALLLGEMELLAFGELAAPMPAAPPNAPRTPTPTPNATAVATATPSAPPRPAAAPPRPSAPPKPPPPKAAAPAPPKPIVPQDFAALRAFHDRVLAADHFEALGVKREASMAQVKAAYFQLAKTYHPDAGPASEPPETKKLRADIFARLGEAWGVLGDDASRAEYVRELESGGAGEVDVSAIFKAEEAFQKAVVLVRTRQYDRALEAIAEAIKLNPDEAEFGVWKAWVDFLVAPIPSRARQAAQSAAAIEKALEKNSRCMPAYLFLGQMAKLCGELSTAERHLKRGLALDEGNAELQRELKFLRK